MKTLVFESLPSTNDYLKEHFQQLDHLTCCEVKHQTKGKGRLGRIWEDDQTQALFSILLKEGLYPSLLSQIPFYTARIVHQILSKKVEKVTIKWPNDLYIKDKKVAGILIESIIEANQIQAIIVGIGINVNTEIFPNHFRQEPTSLFQEVGIKQDISELIDQITTSFETQWPIQSKEEIYLYINQFSYLHGKMIEFERNQQVLQGLVKEILFDGSLLVQTETQTLQLYSGEVSSIKKR